MEAHSGQNSYLLNQLNQYSHLSHLRLKPIVHTLSSAVGFCASGRVTAAVAAPYPVCHIQEYDLPLTIFI